LSDFAPKILENDYMGAFCVTTGFGVDGQQNLKRFR
jgi:hypothetical protein